MMRAIVSAFLISSADSLSSASTAETSFENLVGKQVPFDALVTMRDSLSKLVDASTQSNLGKAEETITSVWKSNPGAGPAELAKKIEEALSSNGVLDEMKKLATVVSNQPFLRGDAPNGDGSNPYPLDSGIVGLYKGFGGYGKASLYGSVSAFVAIKGSHHKFCVALKGGVHIVSADDEPHDYGATLYTGGYHYDKIEGGHYYVGPAAKGLNPMVSLKGSDPSKVIGVICAVGPPSQEKMEATYLGATGQYGQVWCFGGDAKADDANNGH